MSPSVVAKVALPPTETLVPLMVSVVPLPVPWLLKTPTGSVPRLSTLQPLALLS